MDSHLILLGRARETGTEPARILSIAPRLKVLIRSRSCALESALATEIN